MLEENLSAHCNKKHKAAKRILGEASVSGYFASSSKKSKQEESSELESSTTDTERLLATGGRKTPEDNILVRPETPAYEEESLEDEKEKLYLESDHVKTLLETLKKVDLKSDDSLNEIKLLRDNISSLASKLELRLPEFAKPDDVQPIDERIVNLRDCRTVKDILETFEELVFEEETETVLCELCYVDKESKGANNPGQFAVNMEDDDIHVNEEDEHTKQTRKFLNLKGSIRKHFKTIPHNKNWEAWKAADDEKKAIVKRSYDVGMRIARICYVEYKEGNSKRHFETEILKAVLNGVDMGDINHSDQFVRKFRPFVRREIHEKTKQFLNSRLEQTGFYPAMNISADKGTNVHRSRQFTTAKCCVPNSPNLINSIFLGEPVVKHHDGPGVTESIKHETDKFAIKPEQIEGASFDGAYFHQSVPTHLKNSLNLSESFIATHDPLHKTGIVDAHIRKDSNFSWLTSVQETCSEIYLKFNWGTMRCF